ncbi:uncharacterized protein AC631_04396 [Debaryomyces fabryi]|uniref:Thioesterase domain-containing protein n=1 Tax=Debaryomyces fabryi TaxID=58627 RepID=A0A0V1PUG7_9ASCO|nr:uncharacterized protein AC631_04396 [Debaryomyces fabryi]KRZ99839.1 hypothetical protein AC631_04396 [Debaryomyces fabryi]CUM56609.1 unnamed protein product [Debaryomyces fabryi]
MTRDLQVDVKHELITHPIYQSYLEKCEKHTRDNNSPLLEENIWPVLTGETLVGSGKINYRGDSMYMIDDRYLNSENDIEKLGPQDNNRAYTFFHLGHKLSGHQKIIHGGLLATMLDELTCRLAFQNNPSGSGVTANLNINYRQPCFVNTYVLIKCEVSRKVGRKCFVKGYVYKVDLDDESRVVERSENLLTECECLVIEPKWVKDLKHH